MNATATVIITTSAGKPPKLNKAQAARAEILRDELRRWDILEESINEDIAKVEEKQESYVELSSPWMAKESEIHGYKMSRAWARGITSSLRKELAALEGGQRA